MIVQRNGLGFWPWVVGPGLIWAGGYLRSKWDSEAQIAEAETASIDLPPPPAPPAPESLSELVEWTPQDLFTESGREFQEFQTEMPARAYVPPQRENNTGLYLALAAAGLGAVMLLT